MPATDGRKFDDVLDAYTREQPRLSAEIARWREMSVDELDHFHYHDLPDTLIHGDFHADNIFFERRRLTGLLDFDFVRPDTRLADLAITIALDCVEEGTQAGVAIIDPDAVCVLIASYHAESPLSATELRLIVPVIRAFYIWLCSFSVLRWLDGQQDAALRPIRTIDQRLPNLAARAGAIETTLRSAT